MHKRLLIIFLIIASLIAGIAILRLLETEEPYIPNGPSINDITFPDQNLKPDDYQALNGNWQGSWQDTTQGQIGAIDSTVNQKQNIYTIKINPVGKLLDLYEFKPFVVKIDLTKQELDIKDADFFGDTTVTSFDLISGKFTINSEPNQEAISNVLVKGVFDLRDNPEIKGKVEIQYGNDQKTQTIFNLRRTN